MPPEVPRRCGLSPKTLKTVAKFLPKNNPAKPDGFPVSFSEFCELTNVREVTVEAIKISQKKSYEIYLKNEDCILAQEYNFYLNFYKSNEKRNSTPISNICVVPDCPEEIRKVILSFPKNTENLKNFPVSFEHFCEFTNCDEIVNNILRSRGRSCEKTSTEWQKRARRLYRDFYTSKETRKRYKLRIKPCTKTFKSKLLQFAEDIEETTKENFVPENPENTIDVNDLPPVNEPLAKRPRFSSQVDVPFNSFDEKQFPVSFDTFLMHTNIKNVVEQFLENSSKTSPSSIDVIELMKKLYVQYYTKPRYETDLFNELFVRHNYADKITAMSAVQLSTDSNKRAQNVAKNGKVIIQSVQILKPGIVESNNNLFRENASKTNISPTSQKYLLKPPGQTNEMLDPVSNCVDGENETRQIVQNVSEMSQTQIVKMPDNNTTGQISHEIIQTTQPQTVEMSDREQNRLTNQEGTLQVVQRVPQSIRTADRELTGQIAENVVEITQTQAIEMRKRDCEPNIVVSESSNTTRSLISTSIESSWHYPVSFEYFCKHANLEKLVLNILQQRGGQANAEQKNERLNIAQEVYENFYKFPEKRNEYEISFKPLPKRARLKLFEFASKTDKSVSENCKAVQLRSDKIESSCETVVFSTKQLENVLQEEERIKYIKENGKNAKNNNDDNIRNVSNEIDSVERELMDIFRNTPNSDEIIIRTKSTIQNCLSPEKSDAISGGESVNYHQNIPNENLTHNDSPIPDFSEFQSRSLLQTFNISNYNTTSTPELQQPGNENFVEMPNTQMQCDSLLNSNEATLRPDPLIETLFENTKNDAQIDRQQPTPIEILIEEAHTHDKVNAAAIEIKKEVSKFVPLDGFNFELNENEDEFVVTPFRESPILLNDTQKADSDCITAALRNELRTLTDQMGPSTQSFNNSRHLDGTQTFVCTEAQRLPSGINENSQQSQNMQTLSSEIAEHNSPDKELLHKTDTNTNLKDTRESQDNIITYQSSRKNPAVYRVIKSKNLEYDVPPILHSFRALPLEEPSRQKRK